MLCFTNAQLNTSFTLVSTVSVFDLTYQVLLLFELAIVPAYLWFVLFEKCPFTLIVGRSSYELGTHPKRRISSLYLHTKQQSVVQGGRWNFVKCVVSQPVPSYIFEKHPQALGTCC